MSGDISFFVGPAGEALVSDWGKRFSFGKSDVFVPKITVAGDEGAHHIDAALIVEDGEAYAILAEMLFIALEGAVLADDDVGYAKENCGAGTHGAGAEGGVEG